MIIKYLKLVNFKRLPFYDSPKFEHTFTSKLLMINGINGSGKAQPLTSFIKTPNGWDTMGNMKIGTDIIAKDGTITKVNGIFPQGKKEIFKLTFKDGRSTRTTADHLWKVYLSDKYPIESKVVTTLDLINILNINKTKDINKTFIWVDLPTSEQIKDINLPIDPYILGVILGDGCLQGTIIITHPDKFIMDKVNKRLTNGLTTNARKYTNENSCLTYSITHSIKSKLNHLSKQLEKYGLMYKKSYERFIPEEYLYGSINQRLELLQGLMDTDGIIDTQGTSSYCTTSYILATQIQYLIRSLGGIASLSIRNPYYSHNGKKLQGRKAYQINIRYKKPSELFTLPKKKERTNDKNQYSSTLKLSLSSIEPDGFEEAQCISIDHPDKLYITDNFIVTHNSSLVSELTPLPADKNNFNKNGYKEIHIEKDKQFFKLISSFTDGTKYHFLVDDEELNISNNVTMQKELVYKYFNITQSIHELLTGSESFTDMSLLNRKKLFNSITHLNIDKVIENFNTLKEEHKNNEFLLKTQISLSQAEEQKLINTDHFNNLINTQKQIKEYIDTLLDIRTEIHRYKSSNSLDTTYNVFKDTLTKINDILTKYYTYVTSYPTDDINFYNSRLEITDFKLNSLYTSLENKQQELHILNLNKEHDLNSLKEQSIQLTNNKSRIINSLVIFKQLEFHIEEVRNNIYKLEASLPDVLRTIPLNINKRFSKEKYEELVELKDKAFNELNTSVLKEVEIIKELQHLKDHNEDITCPSCSFTWTPDRTTNRTKELETQLRSLLERKIVLQKTIETTTKQIDKIAEYFNIYKQYSTIRKFSYEELKPFWTIVDENEYIFTSPETIIGLVKTMVNDIISLENIITIDVNLKELNSNISILSNLKDTNLLNLQININELTEDITLLQLEKDGIRQHITNNEIANKVNNILKTTSMTLERSRIDLFGSNVSFTVEEVLNVLDSELSKYKVVLIETDKEINTYNNIKYTIEKYRKQIDDIQSNIKVLDIILDELSPKNGLIAKSVSSFLNIIINNVNNIIDKVWEYKMVLKAINVEDEVLNYKFKVEVEDNLTINDTSSCSAGMKKLINFAFILTLYKLLKLDGYPLWLDEFTTNLDLMHSQKFAQLINQISVTDRFSQIFIISHIKNDYYFKDKDLQIIDLDI